MIAYLASAQVFEQRYRLPNYSTTKPGDYHANLSTRSRSHRRPRFLKRRSRNRFGRGVRFETPTRVERTASDSARQTFWRCCSFSPARARAARSKPASRNWADTARSSIPTRRKFRTATRRKKSAKFSAAISMRSRFATCDWKFGNRYINDVAKYSRSPILNMQCDIYHPFQCLADLMTIYEKKGTRLAQEKNRRVVGVCGIVPQTHFGSAIAHPPNAALWHGRNARAIRRNSN